MTKSMICSFLAATMLGDCGPDEAEQAQRTAMIENIVSQSVSGADVRCDSRNSLDAGVLRWRLDKAETETLSYFSENKTMICLDRRKGDATPLEFIEPLAMFYKGNDITPDVLTLNPAHKPHIHIALLDTFAAHASQSPPPPDNTLVAGSLDSGGWRGTRSVRTFSYLDPSIKWKAVDPGPTVFKPPIATSP